MSDDRFRPPSAAVADHVPSELEYVGFWSRVGAAVIDGVLIVLVSYPLLFALYGSAFLDSTGFEHPGEIVISYVFPAAASIAFWLTRQATPGKMAIAARIVDARTGAKISATQAIVRYLGYYVSFLVLGLGVVWIAFDRRKQGWHDKLARTVVVRPLRSRAAPVRFDAG